MSSLDINYGYPHDIPISLVIFIHIIYRYKCVNAHHPEEKASVMRDPCFGNIFINHLHVELKSVLTRYINI